MPAPRGVKRTASKVEAASTAAPSKIKKKAPAAVKVEVELEAPTKLGQVFTCGQGDVGQLGLGEDHMEKSRFTHVTKLPSSIVDICAGGMHTVCIDKDGNVWTFGCNDEGALGRDTSDGSEFAPRKVVLPSKAVAISAGDSHTAALLNTKQVLAWGSFRDSHGNMGLTLKGNEHKPVEMLPGHKVVQIASGGDHLVMLTDQGQIYTCGCGEQGQLGRVTLRSCDRHSRGGLNGLLVPAPLVLLRDKGEFDAIWAGTHCTFARKTSKADILVWGLNNYQQIGVRKGAPQTVFIPVKSEAFSLASAAGGWARICSGPHHTLALDKEGTCYALGRREYGRLGLGADCEDATDLTAVPKLKDKKCIQIACGSAASFAVTDQGEIYAWGMGSSGQLGTGKEEDETEPCLLASKQLQGRSAIGVSAGGQHTVLLVASLKEHIDELNIPEVASTAPQVTTKGDAAEADKEDPEAKKEDQTDAAPKEDDQAMEVDEPAKKEDKPKKPAGKRGRKASSASSSSTQESKPARGKVNGGSRLNEEAGEELPQDNQSAGPSKQEPEESHKQSEEDPSEEPKTKRAKLEEPASQAEEEKVAETEKPAEEASTEESKPESQPEVTATSEAAAETKPETEVAEVKADEATMQNGNGQEAMEVDETKDDKEVVSLPAKVVEGVKVVAEVTEQNAEASA